MAISSNTASVSLAVHSRRSFGLSPLIRADAGLLVVLLSTPRRLNDARGSFARKELWGPSPSSTRAMAVADFDGDGHLDIAACPEELGCFVRLNDGKGTFRRGIQFQTPKAPPYSMTAADLNGDEWQDVVVARSEAPCFVMFNRPPKK
jgi:hypothetical protein